MKSIRSHLKPHYTSKYLQTQSSMLRSRVSKIVERGSNRKVLVKKGSRTVLKVPLTVGLGSATAAILFNASFTAVAAIIALSNEISIKIQSETENESPA